MKIDFGGCRGTSHVLEKVQQSLKEGRYVTTF
jgi:hypothetical protein